VVDWQPVALILPLALDTFAVSAAVGLASPPVRQRLRIGLVFAAFEGGMPMIGVAGGAGIGTALGAAAGWLAIAILLGFGLYTLLGRSGGEEATIRRLPSAHGTALLLLGLSVSLDELAIGFTLGLLHAAVLLVLVLIALQAFAAAEVGMALGARLSERVREGAERLAGLALVALALLIVAQQLTGRA